MGWSYDAAGNLLNDGTTDYSYDALNRAVTIGNTANAYNADGVLVQQGTTRYVQDLAAPLSQILGDGTSTYVSGQERLFAQQGSARAWYATDALGSVRQTLSDTGVVQTNVAYDPWGVPQQGSVPTFGFTGELQQGANVYLRARWYNAQQGTFTSKDSFAGWPAQPYSLHQYQYAYSAPTTWTDPRGQAVSAGDAGGVGPCPAGWTRIGSRCEPSGSGGGSGGSWTGGSTTVPPPAPFVTPAPLGPNPVAPPPTTTPTPAPVRGPNMAQEILGNAGGVAGAAALAGRLPGPAIIAGGICIGILVIAASLPATQVRPFTLSIPQPAPTPEQRYRGAVQIQGQDIKDHPGAVGNTLSWSWSRTTPLPANEALAQLSTLYSSLTRKQQERRTQAYAQAVRYIQNARAAGGAYPPGSSDFHNTPRDVRDARIDVPIFEGRNLVP